MCLNPNLKKELEKITKARRMGKEVVRKYIYKEDYDLLMSLTENNDFRNPVNNQVKFPYILHKVLENGISRYNR